ncbi:MAG: SDR family oxidoreductase [Halieaceae bacterium]|nr:SDR family oxidoreductase [Halieaceae bacterium]
MCVVSTLAKHIVITGPTAGIGRAAALSLAGQGAQLTLLCRNLDKGADLSEAIVGAGGLKPHLVQMDMASLDGVRRAATAVLDLGLPIDVLLNNAGLINSHRRETLDGFEETLAVNHFAPFLLTGLLLPAILKAAPGARIVNVASGAHSFVKGMGFDDIQLERRYKTFEAYGRSKLANILFTRTLSQRLTGKGVTVNCLHPGAVATDIGKQHGELIAKIIPILLKPFFRGPQKGAETSIYLCANEEVSDQTGGYWTNCKLTKVKPWAEDDAEAHRLWDYTQDTLGYEYPTL